jgi:type II secretion system protein H
MNRRAFTLLELIAVIAIFAILSGLSVAGWGSVRSTMSVQAAARQIAMDLRLARMRAINLHTNHLLRFAEGESTYRAQRWDGKSYIDLIPPAKLPKGIRITRCTAPDGAVIFRPRGNASGFGTVSVANQRGETRQVIVDIAGHVRVE